MRKSKILRPPFPIDQPVRSSSPAVPIHEERKICIVEEKFAVESFDRYWYVVFPSDEIQ